MAVIINDLEIVPEPGKASTKDKPGEQPQATPHDIESVVRKQMERASRVWAH